MFRTTLALLMLTSPLAGAVPLCPEGEQSLERDDATNPDGTPGADADAADLAAPLDLDESEIVPCALMDSGTFGPVCFDAVGYLVTDGGAVLCQFSADNAPVLDDARAVTPQGGRALVQIDSWEVAALQARDLRDVPPLVAPARHQVPPPLPMNTQRTLSVWVPPA